jgi:integrase
MLRNHLLPELGELRLEALTPAVLDQYIARKQHAGTCSAKTLNNHLRLLHAMFERAVKWRLLNVNPVRAVDMLKVEQADTDTLTPDEVQALLVAAPPIVRLFTLVAVLTGARRNEVLSLTWDRVDFERALLRVERQWTADGWAPLKSRKRVHAMPAELWQALLDHRGRSAYVASTDFVFATSTGRPIDGSNMLRWFKLAARAAGITRSVWVHQLRHTAGTRAAELGLSALEVAAMLGHAQASTSERYVHLARGSDHGRAQELAAATLGTAVAAGLQLHERGDP